MGHNPVLTLKTLVSFGQISIVHQKPCFAFGESQTLLLKKKKKKKKEQAQNGVPGAKPHQDLLSNVTVVSGSPSTGILNQLVCYFNVSLVQAVLVREST